MADSAIAALNTLLRRADIQDDDEALQLATTAAKAARAGSDEQLTAQHTRVVALLKLDRFDDALRAIDEGGDRLAAACHLEKAYGLYKTGELEAAEHVLQSGGASGGHSRGLKHAAAQVAYRNDKFVDAAAIYRSLVTDDGGQDGEENDLRINLLATDAQLEWQGKGWVVPEAERQPAREDLEAFETAYNAACGCLARGEHDKAAFLLKRARSLCEAFEGLSEEEKKAELAPIIIQQAFAAAKLGKSAEAASFQEEVPLSEIPDASTQTLARNNAVPHQSNPFTAQKLFESVPDVMGSDKLFQYQASLLKKNKYVVELQAQKFAGVQRSVAKKLPRDAPPAISADKAYLGMLNAAGATKLHSGKDAIRLLLPLLESRPYDVGLLLTVVQLYVQLQNPAPALTLLEAFFKRLESANTPDHADVRHAPGLVALAVALYRLQGRQSASRAELSKAVAHWQRGSSTPASADSLLREAGIELLHSSKPSDLAAAGQTFEHLASKYPNDRAITAGLVASFATSDFDKVEEHFEELTPIEKLTAGIDVAALLDGGVATLTSAAPAGAAATQGKKRAAQDDNDDATKQQQPQQPAKKRRRRKLPKSYEEGKTPDPERWLPLRDRSSYRPKGRKGKKRAAEATQGGVVRDEETLALAGGAGTVKVERAPAGGSGGGGGGGGGKKKKKGKK